MRRQTSIIATSLAASLVLACAPSTAAAWDFPFNPATELMNGVTYVAFGDSFSAGEGNLGPNEAAGWLDEKGAPSNDKCHRSPYSYPALAYRYLNSPRTPAPHWYYPQRWIFLACSGAKSKELLNDQVNSTSSIDYFSKYNETYMGFGVPLGEATVTIGGNDIGFSDVIEACYMMIINIYNFDTCSARSKNPVVANLMKNIQAERDQLVTDYQAILDRINPTNSWGAWPKRSLYVLTYPRIFPATPTKANVAGCFLSLYAIKYLSAAQDSLNAVIKSAVARAKLRPSSKAADIRLIDMNSGKYTFSGHDICRSSSARWFYTPTAAVVRGHKEYAYHPTIAGQAMMYLNLRSVMAKDHFFGDVLGAQPPTPTK